MNSSIANTWPRHAFSRIASACMRARIIKAEAELEASLKLSQAAEQMAGNPAALELRRMQMLSEIGAENNSTTVLIIPSDFVMLAKSLSAYSREREKASWIPYTAGDGVRA